MKKFQKNNERVSLPSTATYGIPRKTSQIPSMVGGLGFVAAVAVFTFVGTSSVVNALNRNALNQMSQVQTNQQVVDKVVEQPSVSDTQSSKQVSQLEWAQMFGITWDEHGNPIDVNGNVMNDPTTEVNEVARAITNGTANSDGLSLDWLAIHHSDVIPESQVENQVSVETPKSLYDGIANVSQLADGTYIYTVQSGDCLNGISSKLGVPVNTLVSMNQISNASQINVGQQLVLPADGITQNASGVGLG